MISQKGLPVLNCTGYVARDTVSVAGLTVTNQTFAVANETSSIFESAAADGIMGMAFQSIAADKGATFFENLVKAGALASNVFSFYLQTAYDLTTSSSGTIGGGLLTIGAVDSAKYSGSISYNPVTIRGYWEVKSDGLAINGAVISGTSSAAAIDTGTSLWYVPSSVASAFYSQLGGISYGQNGYYSIPCNTQRFNLTAVFNNVQYSVDLSDLLIGFADSSRQNCVFGIVAQDTTDPNGNPMAIVGDAFLKSVYTVFDYGNSRVGFAPLSASASKTSSTSNIQATAAGLGGGKNGAAGSYRLSSLIMVATSAFAFLCLSL